MPIFSKEMKQVFKWRKILRAGNLCIHFPESSRSRICKEESPETNEDST